MQARVRPHATSAVIWRIQQAGQLAIRQEQRVRLNRSVRARYTPTLVHMEIREALFERAINEQQVHGILSDLWQ